MSIDKQNKIFVSAITLGFVVGFIAGHRSFKDKLEKKETLNQQIKTTQISSTAQNKVANIQDVNSSYTEKFFNKKGILVHEIERKLENRASDLSSTNHTGMLVNKLATTSVTSSIIETKPESSWLIGFSMPFTLRPTFQDVNAQIGYRLVGPFYVTGQVDYRFSNPTIGFLVSF